MRHNYFDDIIKQKADDHKAPVPADAWANIQNKRTKKRPLAFWWLSALFLLICFIISGVYNNRLKVENISEDNYATHQFSSHDDNSSTGNKTISKTNTINTNDTTDQRSRTITLSSLKKSATQDTAAAILTIKDVKKNIAIAKTNIAYSKKRISGNQNRNITGKATFMISRPIATNDADDNKASGTYTGRQRQIKKSRQITSVKIKPAVTEENNIPENEMAETAISKEFITVPGTGHLALGTTAIKENELATKNPEAASSSFTAVKPKKDEHSKKPYTLFIDIAVTGFIPIQQKDKLISINRNTITPTNKAAFVASEIRSTPQAALSYSLAIRKKISNRLYIGTGLQYTNLKEKVWLSGTETNTSYNVIKRLQATAGISSLINDTVSITTTGIRNIAAINSYRFISIPVFLQYKLKGNSLWGLALTSGAYFNFSSYQNSISGTLEQQYVNTPKTNEQQNKFTVDLFTGIRLSRVFNKRYQFYIEPAIQYNLIKYDMQNMINSKYIHKAGISLGLTYAIGR